MDDLAIWLQQLDAGTLASDRVEFVERCLVQAVNDLTRQEDAEYQVGHAGEGLRVQGERRQLLGRLDKLRGLPGAVGVPTALELSPYRLGKAGIERWADATPD